MKKLLTVLLSLLVVLTIAGCAKKEEPAPAPEPEPTPEPAPSEEVTVSSYADYAALPSDGSAVVTIESYVQGAQSYYNGTASIPPTSLTAGRVSAMAQRSRLPARRLNGQAKSN